ncbi:hypothetical protein, partial [Aestuariivirga sp.]|uniref:hypothetical protein n=1 Tax=Aestuariivirga sp. TaxID=2650926 RepID=UPI00378314B7
NRQLYEKRGRPDASAHSCGNLANPKVATFCAALWLTFTLPLTLKPKLPLPSSNAIGMFFIRRVRLLAEREPSSSPMP